MRQPEYQVQKGYDANMTRMLRKQNLPTKICATCARAFTWRKKWERDWEQVRYCSKRCAGAKGRSDSAASKDR
jgi:hypothetical protein